MTMNKSLTFHGTPHSVVHQLRKEAEGIQRENAGVTEEVTNAPAHRDGFPNQERVLAIVTRIPVMA